MLYCRHSNCNFPKQQNTRDKHASDLFIYLLQFTLQSYKSTSIFTVNGTKWLLKSSHVVSFKKPLAVIQAPSVIRSTKENTKYRKPKAAKFYTYQENHSFGKKKGGEKVKSSKRRTWLCRYLYMVENITSKGKKMSRGRTLTRKKVRATTPDERKGQLLQDPVASSLEHYS